jgi:hypothetical protein
MMKNLCVPAVIYLLFSVLQIVFDMKNYMTYTVLAKISITILLTFILNIMCKKGLGNLSWFLVLGVPLLLLIITPHSKGKKTDEPQKIHEAFSWPEWPSLELASFNISAPLVKFPSLSVEYSWDGGDLQFPVPTAVSMGCAGKCPQ